MSGPQQNRRQSHPWWAYQCGGHIGLSRFLPVRLRRQRLERGRRWWSSRYTARRQLVFESRSLEPKSGLGAARSDRYECALGAQFQTRPGRLWHVGRELPRSNECGLDVGWGKLVTVARPASAAAMGRRRRTGRQRKSFGLRRVERTGLLAGEEHTAKPTSGNGSGYERRLRIRPDL